MDEISRRILEEVLAEKLELDDLPELSDQQLWDMAKSEGVLEALEEAPLEERR